MPVSLPNGSVAAIIIFVVSGGIAAGIFHDQSIKAIYSSFDSQISGLHSQVSALQEQTKFTLAHGTVSRVGATPVDIFFDGQDGSTLSSGAAINSAAGYQYQYQLFLKSGTTYGVRIDYQSGIFGGTNSCAGVPVVFTPSGADETQNFQC